MKFFKGHNNGTTLLILVVLYLMIPGHYGLLENVPPLSRRLKFEVLVPSEPNQTDPIKSLKVFLNELKRSLPPVEIKRLVPSGPNRAESPDHLSPPRRNVI